MIAMNHQFVLQYGALRGWKTITLAPALQEIVSAGFKRWNDCVLLGYFADKESNATLADLHDRTGYEAFLNHVHIEKYVSSDIGHNALCFAFSILAKWQKDGWDGELNAIVSIRNETANVRFHIRRPEESWLAQDLDGYSEAVL